MRTPAVALTIVLVAAAAAPARTQCPEEPRLQSFTGGAAVTCPCFAPGEQAGVVLEAPAGDYPIEVLRVGIAWSSQLGGGTQSLEGAIHIYAGGLPDPGSPIFSLEGPILTDGAINEYNLEPLPGEILIPSGKLTVALQFLNASTLAGPGVAHDGNGCQAGRNAVFAIPGGWSDGCALRITGDWVMYAVYRPAACGGEPRFLRADDNGDGTVDLADAVYSLAHQFTGGPSVCAKAMDANGDGEIDIADPVFTLIYLFAGGDSPPTPFPACGEEPAPSALDCSIPCE